MSDETKTYPKAGDWVQVWGQVRPGPTAPDDVIVEFFSHTEQYNCHVLTDRVVFTGERPEFASTCTALFRFAGGDNGMFVRCARHEGHGKKHRDSGGTKYAESEVVGHIEES